jgi:mRNA interferase MazF
MWRGEIWWADLPTPVASEPGDRRPLLIVQSDAFNRSGIRTVVGVVLTSNLRLAAAPGNIMLTAAETGLPRDSVVNVSQIITADRVFLTERIGQVTERVMSDVEDGLRTVLAL